MRDYIFVLQKEEKDEIMKVSSESGYTLLELLRKGIETVKGQKK